MSLLLFVSAFATSLRLSPFPIDYLFTFPHRGRQDVLDKVSADEFSGKSGSELENVAFFIAVDYNKGDDTLSFPQEQYLPPFNKGYVSTFHQIRIEHAVNQNQDQNASVGKVTRSPCKVSARSTNKVRMPCPFFFNSFRTLFGSLGVPTKTLN